ncbi:MAG TPA: SRPBCC family protein [Solirubrobacteraceae bacterium]|nr:SRPBCC family protein [Solirubrobacteraceae bacterium]
MASTALTRRPQAPSPGLIVPAAHAARSIRRLAAAAVSAQELGEKLLRDGGAALTRPRSAGLPIQRAVDVAVPIRIAWEEWMKLDLLPEGTHRVRDIKRRGDTLRGRTDPGGRRWRARVLEERPRESFAWQSEQGADCAGLVTFHDLSRRLTRLEVSLDVVPRRPSDALILASRLGDRRTTIDLRRFKARVEVISPDDYDD